MKRAAILVAGMVLLSACGGAKEKTALDYLGSNGGSLETYQRLLGASDCGTVRREFNTASSAFDRLDKGTRQSKATLGYMEAAQQRGKSLGCR